MDMKLKQHSFMTANTSSTNYFPARTGYSIFSQNLLQRRPSLINRGFATTSVAATSAKSLPYLSVVHNSPLTGAGQGQNNTKSDMGGLLSIIAGLPLVGVMQKLFSSFFSSKDSMTEENVTKINSEGCVTPVFIPEKALNQNLASSYIEKELCNSTCDNCEKSRKRDPRNSSFMTVTQCNKSRPILSAFNPNHFYHKSKIGQKNRLEKQRHNIQCDIHDDFDGLVVNSDEEEYFDPINEDTRFASFEFGSNDISPKLTVIYKCSPENRSGSNNDKPTLVSKSFILSLEDFPLIPENACNRQRPIPKLESPKRAKTGCYRRPDSLEQTTDEEFVVFDNDSVNTTPSSGTGTPSLKSLLISRLKCGGRQRQISECSDDSVVIFFESDGDQQSCWSDTDLSEAEEADETDDDEDTINTMDANQQPDSGFEEREKKV